MEAWIKINIGFITNLLVMDALAFLSVEVINAIKAFIADLVGEEKPLPSTMNLILELTKFGKVCAKDAKILMILDINTTVLEV
jgi:hypothetical protein